GKINASGNYGGHGDDSPVSVEYEPLGGAIPTTDPNFDHIFNDLTTFKFAGDTGRPEDGCLWNGAPFPCQSLGLLFRGNDPPRHTQIFVNTRSSGGYQFYSMLSSMVSTWRYNVRESVDAEDPRLLGGHYYD